MNSDLIANSTNLNFIEFCKSTYILPNEKQYPFKVNVNVDKKQCCSSMKDILLDFISNCVKSYRNGFQNKSQQNILALGYRSKVYL